MSEPTGRGMKTYTVVFRLGDNAPWGIDVPELPRCHSQAGTILSGLDHIREAISLEADVDPDSFAMIVDYRSA
ncbi:MAG: type II toxin-antitoxin system HicB family antitoxin [Actinomycetota bacterium]|nr:type II toxin-antitoxin system HicB family antitoxin [Actinomycetota bacterium]